jgi:chromosome partitioning protein
MRIVSFLHQKGGTGKSTLAVCSAWALAAAGARVLLLDCDYQGTASEWGNRFGAAAGVEVRSQVQPVVHRHAERFAAACDWLLVDGPPSLSEMTESIARAGGRIVIPLRPAPPDVWALPWLAAVLRKQMAAGAAIDPVAVFTQHRGEDLASLTEEVRAWGIPVHPLAVPADPAFAQVFSGVALPPHLARLVLAVVTGAPAEPAGG